MLHALIMAGGGGTRFWPRSRQKKPKQFLTLTGQRSLLQEALDRVEAVVRPENTWVITSATHQAEVARQLPEVPADQIIGEPVGRDTATCIAVGAALIQKTDPEAVMVVTPADHVIEPAQEFRRALHVVEGLIRDHPRSLITIGIPPTYAATGYGYVQRGEHLGQRQGIPIFRVEAFREKPGVEVAEQMVASGEFFWNCGIFGWKAATILDEVRRLQPALAAAAQRVASAWPTAERLAVLGREYEALPRISIDYAVMEKATDVLVAQAPFRWDDVGSWLALERLHPQDADGNTLLANHTGINTHGCVVVGDADRLITTVGVSNLLIIQDGDSILVADRREEGTVKQLVELLKKKGLEKYL